MFSMEEITGSTARRAKMREQELTIFFFKRPLSEGFFPPKTRESCFVRLAAATDTQASTRIKLSKPKLITACVSKLPRSNPDYWISYFTVLTGKKKEWIFLVAFLKKGILVAQVTQYLDWKVQLQNKNKGKPSGQSTYLRIASPWEMSSSSFSNKKFK